jgi:hypothetical protein
VHKTSNTRSEEAKKKNTHPLHPKQNPGKTKKNERHKQRGKGAKKKSFFNKQRTSETQEPEVRES